MMKRSIFTLLLVVVALLSCAHAADGVTPRELDELPTGVTLVGDQEPLSDTGEAPRELDELPTGVTLVGDQEPLSDTGEAPRELDELPTGVTLVGDQEPLSDTGKKEQFIGGRGRFFRHRFRFPYGGGFRYGWRYPLGWWNKFGRPLYGSRCAFARPFGGFFYC